MNGVTEIVTSQGAFTADAAGPDGAPVVLLLHGFPQSRHTWRSTVPLLAGLGYRAVAIDQRGYSPGVRPAEVEAYATDRLVADVLDILDVLGVERAHLVGHDWGGQVAWLTAAHHPGRVDTLDRPVAPAPRGVRPLVRRRRGPGEPLPSPPADDRLGRRPVVGRRPGGAAGDAHRRRRPGRRRRGLPHRVRRARRARGGDELVPRRGHRRGARRASTPAVDVPVLYLWGDPDQTVGRVAAELTAEHVTGPYRFVEIPGGGHFLTDDGSNPTVERELLAHLAANG